MTNRTPLTHLQEATRLTADAVIDVYQLTLAGTVGNVVVQFWDGPATTWMGSLYESIACKISGVTRNSTEERTRPTLTIFNPMGIFTAAAFDGYLDGALLVRKRVLRSHFESNVNIAETQYWKVSRPNGIVSGQTCLLELRAMGDGPDSNIPARRYMPPEFPFVRL